MNEIYLQGYLSTHVEKLRQRRTEASAVREKSKKGTIEEELLVWWRSQDRKEEFYLMSFFQELVHGFYGRRRSAGAIGVALYAAGFRRKRLWSDGPAIRIWVPPKLPKVPLHEQIS
jgi:hypothetical protein